MGIDIEDCIDKVRPHHCLTNQKMLGNGGGHKKREGEERRREERKREERRGEERRREEAMKEGGAYSEQ